jgi:hypothetical protein
MGPTLVRGQFWRIFRRWVFERRFSQWFLGRIELFRKLWRWPQCGW